MTSSHQRLVIMIEYYHPRTPTVTKTIRNTAQFPSFRSSSTTRKHIISHKQSAIEIQIVTNDLHNICNIGTISFADDLHYDLYASLAM